ncbi:MAG: purple acid phosphatase family protein [Planctomycetota bacterium]|jgi:predicted phosphodiesterase
MIRKLIFAIVILLLSTGCSFVGDLFGVPDYGSPRFIKGPYVQNVTPNSATIMWEASERENPSVTLTGPGYEKQIAAKESGPHGRIRLAEFSGLKPATEYTYVVKSGSLTSEPASFRTAPESGASFRMVVYGDTRNAPSEHKKVIGRIIKANPDFILHNGDYLNHGDDRKAWNRDFFEPAAALIKSVPLFPVHGNHEEYADEYFGYFSTPPGGNAEGESGTTAQWYSFTWGCARIVVLDSCDEEHAEQWEFFRKVTEKKDLPWLFVVMHHPPYSSGNYRTRLGKYERLMPMFEKAGVDVLFCGHEHYYERLEKDGMPVIIAGGGGAHPYDIDALGVPHKLSKARFSGLSFTVCEVKPAMFSLTALRPDGSEIDRLVLKK